MNTNSYGGEQIAENGGGWRGSRWQTATWVLAVLILVLPLVAMQFTNEVNWTVTDFALAAVLLFGSLGTYEIAVRMVGQTMYRIAVGVALTAAFLLVWMNFAVGIIGDSGDVANLMYVGVLVVGVVGSITARFRPHGMSRAFLATALAQGLIAVIAIIAELGYPSSGPLEVFILNAFFAVLWLTVAWMFRKAARGGPKWDTVYPRATAENGPGLF